MIVVSLDVKSLYKNVPNSEGVKALKRSLDNFPRKTIARKLIATFQPLILTLSNLVFHRKNYIQIKDCAVGDYLCTGLCQYIYGSF